MASTPVRWEYLTIQPPHGPAAKETADPEAELNRHGQDGWELVDTIDYAGGGTKYLVFKRPADTYE